MQIHGYSDGIKSISYYNSTEKEEAKIVINKFLFEGWIFHSIHPTTSTDYITVELEQKK